MKMSNHLVTETVTKYSAILFIHLEYILFVLCNNYDHTLFFNALTFTRSKLMHENPCLIPIVPHRYGNNLILTQVV